MNMSSCRELCPIRWNAPKFPAPNGQLSYVCNVHQATNLNYRKHLSNYGQSDLVDYPVRGPRRDLRCHSNYFPKPIIGEEVNSERCMRTSDRNRSRTSYKVAKKGLIMDKS